MRGRAVALLAILGAARAEPGTQPKELDGVSPPEETESKCRSCHAGGADDDGKPFRPWDTWAGTMMAQSARDPLYLAALTVAEQDAPGIGTACWRCHSPQGFVKGNATGLGTMLDADDKEGVGCDACHRSYDPSKSSPVVDPMGPYAGNGYLFWDKGFAKRGPYPDADSPAHATIADPFTSSARMCGQCHELYNTRVMMKGTQIPFPLDTTYTEWASSSVSKDKTCVDCHMRRGKGDLKLSTFPSTMSRTDPRTHLFAAANAWGIDAVRASDPALAQDRALALDAARAEALATLGKAVSVQVSARLMGDVVADVRVTNLTGHKFPTGYADGRRAFLRVELLSAGAVLAVQDRVHVYEAVHDRHDPLLEFHIALSDTIAKDTRIPPKGFVPGPTTPILGATYGDGTDDATVAMPVPAGASGTLTVRATVLFQATIPEFVDELVRANKTDGRGQALKTVYEATGSAPPIPIASGEAALTLPPGGGMGPPPTPSGGCSCESSPAPAASATSILVVLGLMLQRRRSG